MEVLHTYVYMCIQLITDDLKVIVSFFVKHYIVCTIAEPLDLLVFCFCLVYSLGFCLFMLFVHHVTIA